MGGQPRARGDPRRGRAPARSSRQPSSERRATIVQSSARWTSKVRAPSGFGAHGDDDGIAGECRSSLPDGGGRGRGAVLLDRRRGTGREVPVGGRRCLRRHLEQVQRAVAGDRRPRARRGHRRTRAPPRCRDAVVVGAAASSAAEPPAAASGAPPMADPVSSNDACWSSPSARRPRTGTKRASRAMAAAAPRTRSAVDGRAPASGEDRRGREGARAFGRRGLGEGLQRRGDAGLARHGIGGRYLAQRGADLSERLDPGLERRVGRDAGRLLGRRGAVEVGGGELVEEGVGHRSGPGSLRSVGRRGSGAWFPGSRSCASCARPRAIRERTVPGGMPRITAISA